jgi:dTDP-4-dehydrorhamnose reductase
MTAEVWLINSAHRHSPAILSAPSVTLSPVEACGILHVTNADSRSWFEFAREILRQAGRDVIRVLPITTPQAGLPSQASGLFRSFTGEASCPWNEFAQLAGGHRRLS